MAELYSLKITKNEENHPMCGQKKKIKNSLSSSLHQSYGTVVGKTKSHQFVLRISRRIILKLVNELPLKFAKMLKGYSLLSVERGSDSFNLPFIIIEPLAFEIIRKFIISGDDLNKGCGKWLKRPMGRINDVVVGFST